MWSYRKFYCCFPPNYRAFLSAWDNVESNRQTLVYLQERLIKEKKRLLPEEGEATTAFTSMSINKKSKTNSNSQRKEQSKSIFKCYNCNRPGHIAKNCRNRRSHHRNQQGESTTSKHDGQFQSNSRTQNNSTPKFSGAFVSTMVTQKLDSEAHAFYTQRNDLPSMNIQDLWLSDSGATKHISL